MINSWEARKYSIDFIQEMVEKNLNSFSEAIETAAKTSGARQVTVRIEGTMDAIAFEPVRERILDELLFNGYHYKSQGDRDIIINW